MGAFAPSKMTRHVLNTPKGWWDEHALDFATKLSSNVTFNPLPGRVVHLNADGEFEMGASHQAMSLFLMQRGDGRSVVNPMFTVDGDFSQSPGFPTGEMTALVATGGFELESSEVMATATSGYAPNQPLTAVADNATSTTGGMLTSDRGAGGLGTGPVRIYTDACCGIVSRGLILTEHQTQVVCFWPVFLPASS